MPIDVSRFVGEENNFDWLNRAGQTIQRNQLRQDQLRQEEIDRQQRRDAKKQASINFLSNYLDPKDHLTGTLYDPQISEGFINLLSEGASLAENGADPNMIMMALAPKVNKLSEYSLKAKLINENISKRMQDIPASSGYVKDKLRQRALDVAFKDENGKVRDITSIDPNIDYITEASKKYPLEVTTNEGLVDFVKKYPMKPDVVSAKTYNNRGGYTLKKMKITAPDFMVLDTDDRGNNTRQLVPRYEIAADDENPIVHDFGGSTAPVRLVDDKVFKFILANNPAYADNLRGQVMQVLKEYKTPDGKTIDINSPQATNVARALVYNDLKDLNPGGVEDVVEQKPTQIRVYNSSGGGKSEITINDLYGGIEAELDRPERPNKSAPINELGDAGSLILKIARERLGNDITQADIFVRKDKDGVIRIYEADGKLVAPLSRTGTNLKVQPSIKEKREVIKQGDNSVSNQTGTVTVQLSDGRKGQIPSDKLKQFLKDNKGAKQVQ